MRPDWEQVKDEIMLELVRSKFSSVKMKRMLLATGEHELIEGNTWGDSYWGYDLVKNHGQNHLGKILMQVRQELREN